MKYVLLVAFSAALFSVHQCTPTHGKPSGSAAQSATSTITWVTDKGGSYPVTDNTSFLYLDNYQISPHEMMGITLQQRIVNAQQTDRECCDTHITVTGTPAKGPSWTIKHDARKGEVYDRFYRFTEGGCCGSNIRYRYFDLLRGQERFTATRPLAVVGVVESCCKLNRYLAIDRLSEPGDDTFVAKLKYGGEDGPSQVSYLVVVPNSQDAAVSQIDVDFLQAGKLTPSINLPDNGAASSREFMLFPLGYPNNPAPIEGTLTGFAFVLTIDKHQRITIPVIEDNLAPDRATLPKGFVFFSKPPKGFEDRPQN